MFLLIETQSDTSNMIPIQREDRVNKPNPQPLALTITCITILYVYIQLLILSKCQPSAYYWKYHMMIIKTDTF